MIATGMYDPSEPLSELVGQTVVLDTAGSILYVGILREVAPGGVWLEQADLHDCREGHAGKELYLCESRAHGVRVNRRRVFVMLSAVISVSKLDDVTLD